MTSTDLNGMIEGDFMYTDQLNLLEEGIPTLDDAFINHSDNHSDLTVLEDIDDDGIEIIHCKINTAASEIANNDVQIIDSDVMIESTLPTLVPTSASGPTTRARTASWSFQPAGRRKLLLNDESEYGKSCQRDHNNGLGDPEKKVKNLVPRGIKKRFDSKNLIELYCIKCNAVIKKLRGSRTKKCKNCKIPFKYQCIQCNNHYKTFQKVFLHVKFQCKPAKNYSTSFHCSLCYYDTRNQKNLDNHVLNHHSLEKCVNCNDKVETSQMTKHKVFECKAAVFDSTNTEDMTRISSDTMKKKRGPKPKYSGESKFLNKYCKSCDSTKEMTDGGEYSTCRDCNTVLLHQCITCCKRFQILSNAKTHVRACNYPPRFQCSECDYCTSYKVNFIFHYDRKHEEKECEYCSKICDNSMSLKKHEKYECTLHPRFQGPQILEKSKKNRRSSIFDAFKLYCDRCREEIGRTSFALPTCAKCNNKVKLQCVKCLVLCNSFTMGYKHVKRGCKIGLRYKCSICSFRISSKKGLEKHMRLEHADAQTKSKVTKNREGTCRTCPEYHRNNLNPEAFKEHLEHCKSLPSFYCSSCSFSTKRKSNLRKHFNNIHKYGQNVYTCSICKNKLKYSSLLKHKKKCQMMNNADTNKYGNENRNTMNIRFKVIEHAKKNIP